MRRRTAIAAVTMMLHGGILQAQVVVTDQELRTLFTDYTDSIVKATTVDERTDAADPLSEPLPFFLLLVSGPGRGAIVELFEAQRDTKQIGAGAVNAGSTSIAVRGDSPSVLGFAFEHGLVTGVRTGETVTFRGNLVGLIEAAGRAGFVESYDDDRAEVRALRKVSFSLSFDPGWGNDNIVDPAADRLTAWSARVDIWNQRDPRHRSHGRLWAALDEKSGEEMLKRLSETLSYVFENERPFAEWRATTLKRVAMEPADTMATVVREQLIAFSRLHLSQEALRRIASLAEATHAFLRARGQLIETFARSPLFVVEYTSSRPRDQPNVSDVRMIAETAFLGGNLVANAAASLFDEVPPGAEKLRHLDGAIQWDLPLKYSKAGSGAVFTIAGRLQRIQRGIVLGNVLLPDTKGTIGVIQLKLTAPLADTGLRIPISVTWANRSELVKERFVRGQIGITFDLDTVITRRLLETGFANDRP